MTLYERSVLFTPAWDKREETPNLGINGVEIWFVLKGPKGVVTLHLNTDWYVPQVQHEYMEMYGFGGMPTQRLRPMGVARGYHSPEPIREAHHDREPDDCQFTSTGRCYCDSSYVDAERYVDILLTQGSEGVWRELEAYYEGTFEEVNHG